jgi:putative flavoprotein involved in K+ transport
VPRTYRGRDILWWLDASGVLDQRYDEAGDLARARNVPSMQLVGSPGRTVDLNALASAGIRLAGRLAGIAGGVAQFSGSLPNVCVLADLKLGRLLNTIDAWAGGTGERFAPTVVRSAWTCGPGRSARSYGRQDTDPICPGSTSRCSTPGAGSAMTAA